MVKDFAKSDGHIWRDPAFATANLINFGLMMYTNPAVGYRELINTFPPRVIHDGAEYAAVLAQVDRLVDQEDLTLAEEDYLDLLGTLIWVYEQRTEPLADYALRGVALVRGLMESMN